MITISSVSKRYGGHLVLDDVSIACPPGTVTGFLGPNGAGKSTTLRILCGLARPTAGTAEVLGVPYAHLANPGRHVGVLLDASAVHPGRTGQETLRLAADVLGVERARVPRMLERVGLAGRPARRRVRTYSLGMRQRLGTAQALLGDPSVLVLDEPANGLDPAGIRWMRTTLREFADRGGTVLLSSHLLREVEAVADRVVVIDRGRVVAAGSQADLLATARVVVRATDPSALRFALDGAAVRWSPSADDRRGDALAVEAPAERVAQVAADAGVLVVELRPDDGGGLERLVMSLTETGGDGGTSAASAPDGPAGSPTAGASQPAPVDAPEVAA